MTPDLTRLDILTIALVAGIVIAATLSFWPLIGVLILSSSLAVVVLPLQRRLRAKMSEELAAAVTTALVLVALVSTVLFTVSVIYSNIDYLAEIVSLIIGWIRAAYADLIYSEMAIPPDMVTDWINDQIHQFSQYVGSIVRSLPFLIVEFIVFFLSLFMFILRGDAIRDEFVGLLPDRIVGSIERMSVMVVDTLYAIYVVHIATSVLTFLLALPFFYLIGFDHVVFYSLLAALFQLVPILGPSFLMIFLGIYALSIGDMRSLVLIAVVGYPVVCALPDIYLRPLMMGMRASIHPVLMWIGFFGGLAVMGLVGFILGPLFVALVVSGYHIIIDELKGARDDVGGAGGGVGGTGP
ncbi:MAG: AI-2E family transporter [Methanomicrobiaceae archaeon]|nr:AI-2E family transporter [Methanomicrobiaceae archaeon]